MSSGDQLDDETDFELKSAKVKRISKIIQSSLIESVGALPRLNFLVFGPGVGTKNYKTHRLAVKNMIRKKKRQNADFPEDIDDRALGAIAKPSDPSFIKKILQNPATKEVIMARGYDFVIIPLMSPGTFSEFSLFTGEPPIAQKIRLFIPKKHAKSKGFLITGPVKTFKKAYDHVRTFRNAKDLLKKVCEMVDDLMTANLLRHR